MFTSIPVVNTFVDISKTVSKLTLIWKYMDLISSLQVGFTFWEKKKSFVIHKWKDSQHIELLESSLI